MKLRRKRLCYFCGQRDGEGSGWCYSASSHSHWFVPRGWEPIRGRRGRVTEALASGGYSLLGGRKKGREGLND